MITYHYYLWTGYGFSYIGYNLEKAVAFLEENY